jgi:hypothetical protein
MSAGIDAWAIDIAGQAAQRESIHARATDVNGVPAASV